MRATKQSVLDGLRRHLVEAEVRAGESLNIPDEGHVRKVGSWWYVTVEVSVLSDRRMFELDSVLAYIAAEVSEELRTNVMLFGERLEERRAARTSRGASSGATATLPITAPRSAKLRVAPRRGR